MPISDNPMFVSVIVTSFNQVATIPQTLDSILSQVCDFPYEIIIGDDCSADGTRDLCLEYQKKYPEIIKTIFQDENVGVAANFVSCVKQACGKYIAICAADDFWQNKQKLQLQVDFFEKNPSYGLLYTDYNTLNSKTGKIRRNFIRRTGQKIHEGDELIKPIFKGKVRILTLTVMFRRELFIKYIPTDDYIKLDFSLEDWPTWIILSKYTRVGFLPVSTATYRYGHESISNLMSYEKIEERLIREHRMYKYLCEMFPDDLVYNEIEYNDYINKVLLSLAYRKLDYSSANKYACYIRGPGKNNLRVIAAKNYLTFYMISWLKRLKIFLKEKPFFLNSSFFKLNEVNIRDIVFRFFLKVLRKTGLFKKLNFNCKVHYNSKEFVIPFINGIGYENAILKEDWLDAFISAFCQSHDDVFVDVGVNLGQSMIKVFSQKQSIKYFGFEPNMACCYYTSKLIELNKLHNAEVFHYALYDIPGNFVLVRSYDYDSRGSIITRLRPGMFSSHDLIFGIDYDRFFIDRKITFVKIDVEGAEYEVLKGMQQSISIFRPLIVCEILDSYSDNTLSFTQERATNVFDLMRTLDYSIVKISTNPKDSKIDHFNLINEIIIKQWTPASLYNNEYLFIPDEKLEWSINKLWEITRMMKFHYTGKT